MASNKWGQAQVQDNRTAEEKLVDLMRKAQAAGQEAGGRISNAYDAATEDTIGDKWRSFAEGINATDDGLMGRAGNAIENIQRRGGRAMEALGEPAEESTMERIIRKAKEAEGQLKQGIMDVVSPEQEDNSVGSKFGGLMDALTNTSSAKGIGYYSQGKLPEAIRELNGGSLDALFDDGKGGRVKRAYEAITREGEPVIPEGYSDNVSNAFSGLMDSAKGAYDNAMEEEPTVSTEGRRVGDVWIENGMMFHMTPEGVMYKRTQGGNPAPDVPQGNVEGNPTGAGDPAAPARQRVMESIAELFKKGDPRAARLLQQYMESEGRAE